MTATHPDYLGVWCPTCKQDCLPLPNGRCGFCDTRVAYPEGQPLTSAATTTTAPVKETPVPPVCKIDGCDNPSAGKGGWCVGLCQQHISEEGSRRQRIRHERARGSGHAKTTTPSPPPAVPVVPPGSASNPPTEPSEAPPGTLTQLAIAADQAQADLDAAIARHTDALQALRGALEDA